jgi:hypothetical protein
MKMFRRNEGLKMMKAPPPPEGFVQFLGLLYPQSFEDVGAKTEKEWYGRTLDNLRPVDRRALKDYLDELLSGSYDDDVLLRVWRSKGPSFSPDETTIREFYILVRNLLSNGCEPLLPPVNTTPISRASPPANPRRALDGREQCSRHAIRAEYVSRIRRCGFIGSGASAYSAKR